MFARKAVIVLALVLAAGAAAGRPGPAQVDAAQAVPPQLARVEALLSHEDYAELSDEDRQSIRRSLATIRRVMGDRQYTSQLDLHGRSTVLTEQERINTLMTRAHDDGRLVCRREKITGSNRPQQVCLTVAERRRAREGSVRYLQQMPNLMPPSDTP